LRSGYISLDGNVVLAVSIENDKMGDQYDGEAQKVIHVCGRSSCKGQSTFCRGEG